MDKIAIKGALFVNDNKENDKHPDKRGVIEVDNDTVLKAGVKYQVSVWSSTSKGGRDYESIRITEPYVKNVDTEPNEQGGSKASDDLPF